MTLFTEVLLNPSGQAVTAGGCLWNLAAVTIGNMIGGIVFVALPYFAASRQK
jgi:nitrite transporter NirC